MSSAAVATNACGPISIRKALDLWEIMNTFDVWSLVVYLQQLAEITFKCEKLKADSGGGTVVPVGQVAELCSVIDNIRTMCSKNHLHTAVDGIQIVVMSMGNVHTDPPDASMVLGYLARVNDIVITDLRLFSFVGVPSQQVKYFEQDQLFGASVFHKFPNAQAELRDAGNSLALDLYDAAVFHLLRVSEHGLRALARKLAVKLKDKGKPQPLEYADWNKVITDCKNRIESAKKTSAGPRKQHRLQLYAEAADHCEYMKDLWRNDSAHTRKRYVKHEALAAFDRVQAFITFLADKALSN
jgi:hypothetical protein